MSRIIQSIADHSLNKKPESSLVSFPKFDDQVEAFPDNALPSTIREMVIGISKAERTPVDLAAACILAIASASIGKGLQVKSGPERKTMGNIYVVASADSGSGKSQVFRHALKPFIEHEKYDQEEWGKKVKPMLEADKDFVEADIKGLRNQINKSCSGSERDQIRLDLQKKHSDLNTIKDKLNPPIYSVENITTEALAVRMEAGDGTLASLSADAGEAVSNLLGRYNTQNRTDDSLYVKAFSGDTCKVDRIGRDRVSLDEPCLTILWLVQPDKIESLLAESQLIEGGLIPRLLICHTNAEQEKIVGEGYYIPPRVRNDYNNLIHALIDKYRKAKEPYISKPTPEHREQMNEFYNEIVDRQKSGDLKDIKSFASRWAEQAWRIAVVLHASARAHTNDLSLDTAEKAIAITKWFARQQLDILSAGRESAWQKIKDKILPLLDGNPNGIKGWDVSRKRITRFAQEGEEVLKRMEAEGILISCEKRPEGGGPISRIYTRAKR